MRGRLFVARVSPEGPADRAGMKSGDILIGVGGEEVTSLAEFYRKVWARGAAGVEVPLRVLQGMQMKEVTRALDRPRRVLPRAAEPTTSDDELFG